MSTTLEVSDLAAIKARIQDQMAAHQASITETRGELEQEQQKLGAVQQNANARRAHPAELQAALNQQQALLATCQTDAAAAVGTSLEAEKRTSLESAQDSVRETRDHLALVQEALEADAKATSHLQEQIGALVGKLERLSSVQADLQATYQRFDQEHASHVRELGLAALQECDDQIAYDEAQLLVAREYRTKVLRKLAADLSAWPRIAEEVLLEHGTFEDPPEAQMLTAKLTMIEALEANWHGISLQVARLATKEVPVQDILKYGGYHEMRGQIERARSNDGSIHIANPTIQGYEQHVINLIGMCEALRHEHKQRQARALLNTSPV